MPHITKKGRVMNDLTLQPGGATLRVDFTDGTSETYPRIKAPGAYTRKLIRECGDRLVRVINLTDNNVEYHESWDTKRSR